MNIETLCAELVSSVAGQYALYLAGGVFILLIVAGLLFLCLFWIVWRRLVRPWRTSKLAKRTAEKIDCARLKEYSAHVHHDMKLVSRLTDPAARLDVLDRLIPRLAEMRAMYPAHKRFAAFHDDMLALRACLLPPPVLEATITAEVLSDAPELAYTSRLAIAAYGIKRVLSLPITALRVRRGA